MVSNLPRRAAEIVMLIHSRRAAVSCVSLTAVVPFHDGGAYLSFTLSSRPSCWLCYHTILLVRLTYHQTISRAQ